MEIPFLVVALLAASMIPSGMTAKSESSCSCNEKSVALVPADGNVDENGDDGAVPAISSCGGNNKKWVAITFDDGPETEYGEGNLAELKALGVQASFYFSPNSFGYPRDLQCKQARDALAAGHTLELHTMNHVQLSKKSTAVIDAEINEGMEFLKECGIDNWKPTQFRPPYGSLRPDQARHIAKHYGLTIAMWNVESDDSEESLSEDDVFNNVVGRFEKNVGIGNSAVILMHSYNAGKRRGSRPTGIITRVVEYFSDLGYVTQTMPQCYAGCNSRRVCKGSGGPTDYPGQHIYIP